MVQIGSLGWVAAGVLMFVALIGFAAWRFQAQFGVTLWPFKSGPPLYTNVYPERVKRLLDTLLERGHNHGFLVLQLGRIPKAAPFIQFRKYSSGSTRGIVFGFPLAAWSSRYYERLQRELEAQGIRYEVKPAQGKEDPLEFLIVDVEEDLALACSLVWICFERVFEITPTSRVDAWFHGLHPAQQLPPGATH